jgi:hypothetical protein
VREHDDVHIVHRDAELGKVATQLAREPEPTRGGRPGGAYPCVDQHGGATRPHDEDVHRQPPAPVDSDRRGEGGSYGVPTRARHAGERARVVGERVAQHVDHDTAKVSARDVTHDVGLVAFQRKSCSFPATSDL